MSPVYTEGGLAPAPSAKGNSSLATSDIVINAAGPWIDQLLAQATSANSPRLIGGTKGSHIVVRRFDAAPDTAIYVESETDGRPFFIIPWNGNLLIGTTDIRYHGDLDRVRIEKEEIDYLLRETNRVMPQANLTREHVLYAYSGVRPLPFTANNDEPSITRRHFIRRHPRVDNLFSIVGGKLTTYRSLAEQAVDLVFQTLERQPPECTTGRARLPGAPTPDFSAFSDDVRRRSGLSEATADHLLRVYGRRASLILELIGSDASLAEVFDDESGAIAGEVVFAFEQEFAQTLSDCLLRRTMVGLNSSAGVNALDAVSMIARRHLGWSTERIELEIANYRRQINAD
jgi:glycerol-3-phosphate dehydrogenase